MTAVIADLSATSTGSLAWTRRLLVAGAAAAPLFAGIALAQVATRPGFDFTRHPVSMLSNGPGGWLQGANFLVAGLLTVVGAIGVRRSLRGARGGRWAPRLLAIYGVGFVAASFLSADPGLGFPPGTPDAMTTPTGEGIAHMAAGSVAFISLIALCFVFVRAYPRLVTFSRAAGTLFVGGLIWSFSGLPGGPIALFVGDVLAWSWVAIVLVLLSRAPRSVR